MVSKGWCFVIDLFVGIGCGGYTNVLSSFLKIISITHIYYIMLHIIQIN